MRRVGSILLISAVLALPLLMAPVAGNAQIICVSNNVPPPDLPIYAQPPIPAPGYIWAPGYWAGGPSGYFWVPGTWVQPPTIGLLWTPGYWGWRDGIYVWSAGYWGPHVGFYGGINYGFGYAGSGYEGGHWDNGVFAYNRTVNNFGSVTITNVYEKTVVVNVAARVSFNGGSGGTVAQPTPDEEAAAHEQHTAAIPAQTQHERVASADKSLLASENHGRPPIAATASPGDFTKGVVAARDTQPASPLETKPGGAAAIGEKPSGLNALPKDHQQGKTEATVNKEAPPRPLNAETKPLVTGNKPANTLTKPLNTEAKPPNGAEGKSSTEAKLPPGGPKPELQTPLKPENPQPSHLATTPLHTGPVTPHPGPVAKTKKPSPENKKQTSG
jgi:hypothetical protein